MASATNQPEFAVDKPTVQTPGGSHRVLMIAAAFPPTGGPGVQRSAKFAKYLPQFGWRPFVWTLDRLEGLPADSSLRAELPADVKVHSQPAPRGVLRALRKNLKAAGSTNECGKPVGLVSKLAGACSWRLESYIEGRTFPDEFASWTKKSLDPLQRLVKEQSIDVIYSTFSPASNHHLAMMLKEKTGLPWIADFRDLWTDDYRYIEQRAEIHEENVRLEEEILDRADVVIGVTPRQTAILSRRCPQAPSKFVTITNGFDPEDFVEPPAGEQQNGPKFVLAHVGRFDKWRATDALLEGLGRFVSELGCDRDRFELRLVGHADRSTLARVKAAGVEHIFVEHVPHREATAEMVAADALLLALPDGPNAESVIAAKLFEYLASRRPILVVGPHDGECERIVKNCRAGVTADFKAEEVAAALRRLYKIWEERRPLHGCAPADAEPFSRVALTRQLVSLFAAAVDPVKGDSAGEERVSRPAADDEELQGLEPVSPGSESKGASQAASGVPKGAEEKTLQGSSASADPE